MRQASLSLPSIRFSFLRSIEQRVNSPNEPSFIEQGHNFRGTSVLPFPRNLIAGTSTSSTKRIRPVHCQSAAQISVVIPTYRVSELLHRCLEALVEQTFDKSFYEIIVVSDGHESETENLVNSFGQFHPSICYLHSQKRGPAAARNLGWQAAAGKLIAFTNDDCVPDETWLASLYKTYKGEEEIAYAGTLEVPASFQPPDFHKRRSRIETGDFVTANCCCTKMALEKVEGFDERFCMTWCEGSDVEFKLIQKNIPVVKVDQAVVIQPVRKSGWRMRMKELKKGIFNALLYRKFPDLYRQRVHVNLPWDHSMVAVAFTCFMTCLFVKAQLLAVIFLIFWVGFTLSFIVRRLVPASKSWRYVFEMVITSMIIPFATVYWQMYGAVKYRTFFR